MHNKIREIEKIDMIKEVLWATLQTIVTFVYWVVLLLAITFVFNSIIKLTFEGILLISAFLTTSMLIFRIVKYIRKQFGHN